MDNKTSYIVEKFYSHAGNPTYNKFTNTYNGSCPSCREGKSWLKKKRLFFYPESNSFFCFNCSKHWNYINWIGEICALSKEEIIQELYCGESSIDISRHIILKQKKTVNKKIESLPYDSVNILDSKQNNFYNKNEFFRKSLDYIKSRKLDTAINRSPLYFISFKDFIHSNRLCIPYYDLSGKIIFYQTRSLDGSEPRYLNKIGHEKSLFGIERVDPTFEYIFLFEGPIDAMMVKNGVAVAGLTLTEKQKIQLNAFPFHKKVWVLDNPKVDSTSKELTKSKVMNGESIFKWIDVPYKDFNEWAVSENLDEIHFNTIIDNMY